MEYNGNWISINSDYGFGTQKKRKLFEEVKHKLSQWNVFYALLPPAHFRSDARGKRHFFDIPEEAIIYVETLGTAE